MPKLCKATCLMLLTSEYSGIWKVDEKLKLRRRRKTVLSAWLGQIHQWSAVASYLCHLVNCHFTSCFWRCVYFAVQSSGVCTLYNVHVLKLRTIQQLEVLGPVGPRLIAFGPSSRLWALGACLTSLFAPFGLSGCVTHTIIQITDGGSTAPLYCWYHTEEKTIQEHKRDWKDVRGIVGRR